MTDLFLNQTTLDSSDYSYRMLKIIILQRIKMSQRQNDFVLIHNSVIISSIIYKFNILKVY